MTQPQEDSMQNIMEQAKDRLLIFPYIARIFPAVEKELAFWRTRASSIPDAELRKQALAGIADKKFHCLGGSIYALYAPAQRQRLLTLIVALQTMSDYLDNLCDRVEGSGEESYRRLHRALCAALDPAAGRQDWYEHFPHKNDGGYLDALVAACKRVIAFLPGFGDVREEIAGLAALYSDLQVFKHLAVDKRKQKLVSWFADHSAKAPGVTWWEFAAAAGSTLGIFALSARAAAGPSGGREVDRLLSGYFPWISGLHILLDYFIDLDEDETHNDLNFVSHYPSPRDAEEGLLRFLREALQRVKSLPRPAFHGMVASGLPALYLSDPKALAPARKKTTQQLLRAGGPEVFQMHRVCLGLRRRGVI
jgi:tetraprenyl-beta-curcumene synthase